MADRPGIVAVLDACVLAPMPIADTLLRLAESKAFYIPRWSPQILDEVSRTLAKFGVVPYLVERRIRMMRTVFSGALVENFDHLIPSMTNDVKDRHVVAAAVSCSATVIVSDNRKHFPAAALSPYGLECLTADAFIERQFRINPEMFVRILEAQAASIQWTVPQLLARHTPSLSRLIGASE